MNSWLGVKGSLQYRLSLWLSIVIFVVAIAAGYISYSLAFKDAHEFQDEQLQQMATLLNPMNAKNIRMTSEDTNADENIDDRVFIQSLDENSHINDGNPALSRRLPDGLQTLIIDHISWRVFVKTLSPEIRVALSQKTEIRDEIAQESAARTSMPILLLLPLLIFSLNMLIGNMFKPLKKIAEDIDERIGQGLKPITYEKLPSEIKPFIHSINQLLMRVADSLLTQRRFVADAAHELRSPLTALSIQAENLEALDLPEEARIKIIALRTAIKRASLLQNQLLTLARINNSDTNPFQHIPVSEIFRHVIEDMAPLAERKNIDLGVTSQVDFTAKISDVDFHILVKNLVDNAIRYTQPGGRVDISTYELGDIYILQVSDNGPGITESEHSRVLDPFYRLLGHELHGSGLGLSIVNNIAMRANAKISMKYTSELECRGLTISISFPSSKAKQG